MDDDTSRNQLLKLDLGCGATKRVGFLGIDRRRFDGVDGVTDLSAKTWLFQEPYLGPKPLSPSIVEGKTAYALPDNSVEEVYCSHFLEHLEHNQRAPERVKFMNEMWRVIVPGGKATLITPHWASSRAFGDFTHADKPVTEMFYFYLNKNWRAKNALDNDISFNPDGYTCDFLVDLTHTLNPHLQDKSPAEQSFAVSWYKEAAVDLVATLTARK